MESLLGVLHSRIKGSQEDIASEGLVYILRRSKAARQGLSKMIKADCELDISDPIYPTQNVGEKLERPDISGHDITGKEVVILEAKFWAALTHNQPIGYLTRLKENTALYFICPNLRVRPIYDELVKRLREAGIGYVERPELHSIVVGNKSIIVKTWNEVLSTIRIYLEQANEQTLLSDIDQITGLCHTIDSNSFLPIQIEDLSPGIARRINSYYDLTDKIVHELIKKGMASTKKLKATPQRNGYTRYLHIHKFGVALHLNFDFWARYADTPFWIVFKEATISGWPVNESLALAIKKASIQLNYKIVQAGYNDFFFALFPLTDKTEDLVITDLSEQIIKLADTIQAQWVIFNNVGQ